MSKRRIEKPVELSDYDRNVPPLSPSERLQLREYRRAEPLLAGLYAAERQAFERLSAAITPTITAALCWGLTFGHALTATPHPGVVLTLTTVATIAHLRARHLLRRVHGRTA